MSSKTRDYLFDNYKALLIFLVVVGHFAGPSVKDNDFLLAVKWVIVSFHMPAFVFISGYFSKKELSLGTCIRKLAVPYLICDILYYLLYTLILHQETVLALHKPKFTLWYLLALFFWRVITPYVKRIPHYMLLAIVAGLLIGCSDMESNFLTIPRALVFYPFYLAGTVFDKEKLQRIRHRKPAALLLILCLCTVVIFWGLQTKIPMQIFYGRYSYSFMKQSLFQGVIYRCLAYLIGFSMTLAVLVLMSEKKLIYSYLGTRTMAIYLFHGLLYTYLHHATKLLDHLDTWGESFLLLAACAGITVFFSLQPFTDFTNALSNFSIPHFGNKNGTA